MNTSTIAATRFFKGMTIGLLSLGQTPRPDLVASLEQFLPEANIRITGALDGLEAEEIEKLALVPGNYPLMVLLADRSSLEIDMQVLYPLLARKAEKFHAEGAQHIILMCSGGFPVFETSTPVLRPVSLLQDFAGKAAPRKRVGIINPIASQQLPAARYWEKQGFTVHSASASPFEPEAVCAAAQKFSSQDVECVILDCMSFTEELRERVQKTVSAPVLIPMQMIRYRLSSLSPEFTP